MIFYCVSDNGSKVEYCGTLDEAHKLAKTKNRFYAKIEEVEVVTSKANILRILNGADGFELPIGGAPTWELTPRGGLHRMTPEEVSEDS